MKLIVGLGNPGARYAQTRHNLGFMIVDELARRTSASWRTEAKFQANVAEVATGDDKLLLAKPQTFMNNSGEAVQKLMQFYKLAPADVWVVTDDLDTPFGRLRVRTGGSAGGHQGLASLTQHIGSNFVRMRIGISLNDRSSEPSETYVLKPFNDEESTQLEQLIAGATDQLSHQLTLPSPEEATFGLLP